MRFRYRILFLLLLLFTVSSAYCQNSSLESLKKQREGIEQQIAASEKLLSSTDKDISSQLSRLNILTDRLKSRHQLLENARAEVRSLDAQLRKLTSELDKLQKEYDECKERYAAACKFYQVQKSSFNPLLFLFSSDSYRQLTRRFRYVREYSQSISVLADEIAARQRELEKVRSQVEETRKQKLELQNELAEQEAKARSEEKSQKDIVSKLKSKRSSLKNAISKQQKEITALGKEIDRLIAEELKKSSKSSKGNTSSEADLKLTGSFESNKGKLPVPITGTYLLVGNYGIQNVAGMKDVKLNNLGIDLQGENGAQARVVFDGTVTTVFQQGKGQIGVLVRHGSYISVYCNLSEAKVKKGDKLKTGDIIGNIGKDSSGRTILHFQLHKESEKLNPSLWIKK